MNVKYCMYTYCHLYFYHLNCTCIAWFYTQKNLYRGFLEYIVNTQNSWLLMKGAPLGANTDHNLRNQTFDRADIIHLE